MNGLGLIYYSTILYVLGCSPCSFATPHKRNNENELAEDIVGRSSKAVKETLIETGVREVMKVLLDNRRIPKRNTVVCLPGASQEDITRDTQRDPSPERNEIRMPHESFSLQEDTSENYRKIDVHIQTLLGPPKVIKQNGARRTGSRETREDHVIDVDSDDLSLPWEEDCSGGYRHCDGYFPECCVGFVCYKPLTDWDRRYGMRRCWPSYFLPDSRK